MPSPVVIVKKFRRCLFDFFAMMTGETTIAYDPRLLCLPRQAATTQTPPFSFFLFLFHFFFLLTIILLTSVSTHCTFSLIKLPLLLLFLFHFIYCKC